MRVLIVGSGIVGASTAFHLARAGTDVVVVDRHTVGQATAAGAGVVFPYQQAVQPPGWRPLVGGTLEHWADVVDPFGAEAGVAATEAVYLADDEAELRDLHGSLEPLAGEPGYDVLGKVRWLAPGELADQVPVLRTDLPGLAYPGARRVDGRVLTDRLLTAAEEHGATRLTGTAAVEASGDTVRARVDGEPVPADAVVVAAGAWSRELCAPLGVDLPVRPVRGQILHLDSGLPGTEQWPILRHVRRNYLLGFPGGRVVSGALHEPDAGFEHRRTASGVATLLGDALALMPGLADATFAEVRVGFRPVGTDDLPTLGRLARHPEVVVATGLGPYGLTFGPYAGALAADLATGREPTADLDSYRPDRRGQAR